MMLKTIGIACIILGGSGGGAFLALSVKRSVDRMEKLSSQLQQLKGEIAYHKTPLPHGILGLSLSCRGELSNFWREIAGDLEKNRVNSPREAMEKALGNHPGLFPKVVSNLLKAMGRGLGQYSLEAQIATLDLALERLETQLVRCRADRQGRMKSYATLGVCGALAIAILLL